MSEISSWGVFLSATVFQEEPHLEVKTDVRLIKVVL